MKGNRFPNSVTSAPKPVEEIGMKQDELENVLHDLQIKLEKSKTEIIHLLAKNQEKDKALEKCDLKVKELQNELSNVSALQLIDMKGEVAKQVKPVVDEKRSLQIKHEQICAKNKNLKEEKETLMNDTNSLNVALKAAMKESKEGIHKLEKTRITRQNSRTDSLQK